MQTCDTLIRHSKIESLHHSPDAEQPIDVDSHRAQDDQKEGQDRYFEVEVADDKDRNERA